jgi:hypothetical protein
MLNLFTGLESLACASCGVTFGMTDDMVKRRRSDHRVFYCPSGHENYEGT